MDQSRLSECSDFYTPELPTADWQRPALAALPRLREDFSDWTSLDSDRQREVLTAAFATATLLDDTRLLVWAAEQADDIAQEYDHVMPQAVAPGPRTDIEPSAPEGPDSDVLGALRDNANALAAAANVLGVQPTAEMFDIVEKGAADILKLREVALESVAAEAIGNLLSDFATLLLERAQVAPWLVAETDRILDAWRSTYLSKGARFGQLKADIQRAADELEERLAKWAGADRQAAAARAGLDHQESEMEAKGAPSVRDLEAQARRSSEVSSARQVAFSAMREVLDALEPAPSRTHEIAKALGPDDTDDSASAAQPISSTGESTEPFQPVIVATQRKQVADDDAAIRTSESPPPATRVELHQSQRTAVPTEPTRLSGSAPDVGPPEPEQGAGADEVLPDREAAIWEAVGNGRLGPCLPNRPTEPSGGRPPGAAVTGTPCRRCSGNGSMWP